MKPWSIYAVGDHDPNDPFQGNRKSFTTVSHTSHVDPAIEIVRKGEIRAGLVFDKSCLNDKRILVAWISPNTWGPGYRYGNIKFDLDFKTIIRGKKTYWVESITTYSPPAPRILITEQERSKDRLTPYDPEKDDGPWRYDRAEDKHYYNGNFTLEFMFEGDINLTDVTKIDFVQHHPTFCSISSSEPTACEYLGTHGDFGGARFLARCVASGISLIHYATSFIFDEGDRPSYVYEHAVGPILRLLCTRMSYTGTVEAADDLAEPIACAFLHAFSYGRKEHARLLASQFKSEDACLQAVAELLADAIKLTDWRKLLNE